MFRTPVSLTPPFTDDLYKKYNIANINGDQSLYMTVVTLLYCRVQNFKFESTITQHGNIPYNTDPSVYSFHWVETNINPDESLELIKDKFKSIETLNVVEKYVKDNFNKNIYIRLFPHENAVAIYLEKITLDMWHLMQSFISRYFKIFEEKPLSNREIEFVRTLILKTPDSYLNKLEELTDNNEFKEYALKIQLEGFEKTLYKRKLEAAQNEILTYDRKIQSILQQYQEFIAAKNESVIRFEGLKSITDGISEKTELQEYLIENKNLTRFSISNSHINFVVKTYLVPYLTDSWENMSERGAIFDRFSGYGISEFNDVNNIKLLVDAIFSSRHCLKLRMCAHIDLDYLGNYVRSNTSYNYSVIKDYIPNPHLQRHACFGQNGPDIVAQLAMGDPIGAIECAINCVKHVNVDELSATFIPFVGNLLTFQGRCLVTEDNKELTPVEAVHYLKEKQNESNSARQPDETSND